MSKERKEAEAKILAQMDEAMKENEQIETKPSQKYVGPFRDKTPQQMHCRKCNTLMENGKCPTCGYSIYVPMNDKKQKEIRWIIGGVCLLAFVIILLVRR